MKKVIIIPARYQSSRFPGKPLVQLLNAPAILWTLEAARQVSNADAIYVATDDPRIADVVAGAGGSVCMTSSECRNGTERVAEAAAGLSLANEDIIVNLQGDAPLTPHWFVEEIIDELSANPTADMVTPVLKCDEDNYQRFVLDRKNGRVGATTAVFSNGKKALYFSKEVIPFLPDSGYLGKTPVYHHVGVYAYRMSVLRDYAQLPVGPLETSEQLEQLRFLENDRSVFVKIVESHGAEFWELNNPEDVAIIEAMMTEIQAKVS